MQVGRRRSATTTGKLEAPGNLVVVVVPYDREGVQRWGK